jgi:hypothetical protein
MWISVRKSGFLGRVEAATVKIRSWSDRVICDWEDMAFQMEQTMKAQR